MESSPEFILPHSYDVLGGGVAVPRWKNDEKLTVEFYEDQIFNEFRTKESRQIEYDTVEMVKIINPADRFSIECHKVDEIDRRRFPLEYQLFKSGRNQIVGTAIETVDFVSQNQAAKLRHIGIRTVEQLERLTATEQMQVGLDGKELRDNAAKYMTTQREFKRLRESAEAKAEILSEIDKVRQELEELRGQREKLVSKKGGSKDG